MNIRSFSIILITTLITTSSVLGQQRDTILLHRGWKFMSGDHPGAIEIGFNDSDWTDVTVPHDWAIAGPFIEEANGSTGKLPWKGEGWYRLKFSLPDQSQMQQLYLLFDGVMAFPEVYINGALAGRWDYGYNSFWLDVTTLVSFGEDNILTVHADTREHDSRWYPGAGIYRNVKLILTPPVHTDIWGTYVTTPIVKPGYAEVRSAVNVRNMSPESDSVLVRNTILNAAGYPVVSAEMQALAKMGNVTRVETSSILADPHRWDIDDPYLYTLMTEIIQNNGISDVAYTPFGVRTIRFTPDHGFWLNERRVQLKGVNLHHDHGPLGAAYYEAAMKRQLKIMQEMGVNAIRTSHNTPAPGLLDLCDRMGILVFNEVFDKYDGKADILDTTDFENFARRNIRNFVVRDRNHPCIFLWSVGNEITDVQLNQDNGFHRLHTMVNYVRKYDPTRPVTMVTQIEHAAALRHFDYFDVHCYNYGRRYRLARQIEPNKSVIVSESASTVSTRGFYEFPLPGSKTEFTRSMQVSSYDLNAPPWAEIPDDDFMWQQEEEYIAGEFVWTGFDYLGEPTPYDTWSLRDVFGFKDRETSRSSYFGIVDLCGIPKDRYFLYKSYWKPEERTVHILPHWNWTGREGDVVPVFVYTNGDCAELFINGESQGLKCKKPASPNAVDRFRLMWDSTVYVPGEVKAVACREGRQIGEAVVRTAGEPFRLKVTPNISNMREGGLDLVYLLIEAVDRDGNPCPLASGRVEISLDGPGEIAGVGNGNPRSYHPFQSDDVHLFYGKAIVIVRSGYTAGSIDLGFSADGYRSAGTTIEVKPSTQLD